MRRRLVALLAGLGLAAGAGGALLLVDRASGTDDQQGALASLISRALSSPTTKVHIGAVDGALSSDATIRDIVLSDGDGPWLKLDRAHIAWRRAALLLRRLEIDDLAIGHLEVLRRPTLHRHPDKPLLPDLPVKVEIKQFAMANLDLGAPILGTPMRAAATGSTVLGSPSEGLKFSLDGKRLDSPGSLEADLDYVPKGQALHVKIALDEPPGGLLSQVAHLPGKPPVTFRLGGDGTLDAFEGRLAFHAGPTIDADGRLTLQRHDALGRDLAVRIGGHLGALLPTVAAPVFEGSTDLVSDARFGDDRGFSLGRLALTSRLARLDAHGTLGADSAMDFDLAVRAVPSRGDVSALGGATIRKLIVDAAANGTVRQPRVHASLSLADADLPQGRLGALDAHFAATPSGDIASADTRLTLEGGAEASGIAPRDTRLAAAIGGSAKLALAGHVDRSGVATFETLAAETPTASLAYAGDLAASRVHGRATARVPDLSRLGRLAGLPLAGSVAAGLDLDGAPDARTMHAAIAASARDLVTGLPAVDGLLGHAMDAHGSVRLADDGLTVDDLALDAAHVSARVAGTIPAPDAKTDAKQDATSPSKLDAHIALPDLARADPRLTGAAHVDTVVTGDLAKPAVTLEAALENATALGRPIPHLALIAHVTDPRGAAVADATLDGSVDRKPAHGQLALARHGGGWDLSKLDVAIGSVAVRGGGRIDDRKLVDGSLRLAAGNLDDLSPLALTKLGGTLSLDAAFAAPDAKQNATLTARASDLVAGPANLHALAVRAEARDLYGKPVVDADAKLDHATVSGQTISAASLTAKGAASRSAINLSARAAGFDLDAAGALVPDLAKGAATRLELASFSARRGEHRIALAGPATLTLADGGVTLDRLALGIAGGRVAIAGRAGKTLDLTAEAKAIPLAAADIAVPGLGLSGTLEADARISGTPADPTGPYHVTIKHLVAPQAREAGLPPIDVAASGKLGNRRASLDARIAAGRAGTLQASGSLSLDAAGLLDLAVRGKLDAAVANTRLSAEGRSVSGSVLVDVKLAGTRAAPRLAGSATLSGGTFRDALYGVRLDGIEARVAAKGDRVAVERLAATTPNGGHLSGSGDVKLDPAGGFPGHVTLQGKDAQLVASSLMTATANLDLTLSGALARAPRVAGRVDLVRARVGVPDRLPTTLQPLPGVTHVNPPAALAAKLAAARRKERLAKGAKSRPALFEAGLDVTVAAENGLFVRGRGIDAELGGKLHVTGSTAKPVPQGGFELQHGTIAALGKTMTFSKGDVTFAGDLMPEVDFAAQIAAPDITAQIVVTGPATAPTFKFSSIPELPQDEVLSRVMFQKPSGSLSGFQALQLAQAAAQFSGDGDSAYQKMMSSLGVTPSASGDDGPMSKLSRALGDRVSVGVVTGATADQTGLSADVAVSKHLRVQSDVRSNGATSVGVGSEVEY